MEMNEKLVRDLKRKFEAETNKREAEILEYWKTELEAIYKKRYESLASLQVDMKNLMDRINNRIAIVRRQIKESS